MKLNKFMLEAIHIANSSKCRYRHGCVVVSNGQIVGKATNKLVGDQSKTSWRKSHVHAEIAALNEAGDRAIGSVVYVARIRKDGTPADSKPCKKCESQLTKRKVKKVLWT